MQSLEDDGAYKNGWLICTQGKSFAVYAATATEKQEWMAHIDKVFNILWRFYVWEGALDVIINFHILIRRPYHSCAHTIVSFLLNSVFET